MMPTALHTASWKGITSLSAGLVKTTRALAAPRMPISAQNIQAGKYAPNNSNEGAPMRFATEQSEVSESNHAGRVVQERATAVQDCSSDDAHGACSCRGTR